MEDTICAVATALGTNAISIIRVSGDESIPVVNKIFKGKDLASVPTHTIWYGHIIDNDKIVDEVLVTVMKGPRSFTTEDVVEINCHGGIATTNKVLELLLRCGIRLAEPGEFTKRAFLNGRIDLLKAEGVMDLIEAKTEKERSLAINEVSGSVSKLIHNLREDIVSILTNIEVNIDYPEYYDIKEITNDEILPNLEKIKNRMKDILKKSEHGKIVKEGIKTSIVGRPNAGKSSLLNSLLEEEKAIVTDIPGTTRDIVEGTINLDGIILDMTDTAGIRKTEDKVEHIGVQRSLSMIEKSNLILFVLNNNEEVNEEEKEILKSLQGKNYIVVINKIDLKKKIDESIFDKEKIVHLSLLENKGLDELKEKIKEMFHLELLETSDFTYLSNARSIALLKKSMENIDKAIDGIQNGFSIDMIEIDIKEAWNNLGEIIGETYTEELIDQLFSQFCLGK